jgi:hypothetical protein
MATAGTDWHKWHEAYDDPKSRLSRRLRSVQEHLRAAVDERASLDAIRLISMCAGQGRDVIGALADHPRSDGVSATLVELDEGLAAAAQADAQAAGLHGIRVMVADASMSDAYEGAVPADIVLACGIFGNISDEDIRGTIDALPMLCAPSASVLWTRYGKPSDDIAPEICRWFEEAGFALIKLDAEDELAYRVGSHRLVGAPRPLEPGVRFFTFTR